MGVGVPFGASGDKPVPSLDALVGLVAADMDRVNDGILARAQSHVELIPEIAGHLINSGGKRIRPMLTLASARMCGYAGEHHIKLATAVEFMHTATLLQDDGGNGLAGSLAHSLQCGSGDCRGRGAAAVDFTGYLDHRGCLSAGDRCQDGGAVFSRG